MGREGLGPMVTYRIPGVRDMVEDGLVIDVEGEETSIGCCICDIWVGGYEV
jgi:hypothetical protein